MAPPCTPDRNFHVHFVAIGDSDFGWLGLGYLSATLKRIAGVTVTATYCADREIAMACDAVVARQPDLVGLPVLQNNLKSVREFVRRAKPLLPGTHFSLGNKEVTAQPELMLNWCPGADSVVIGEGEHTLAQIVQCLKAGRPCDACAGAYFRTGGMIRKNAARPLETDLEQLGNPDRAVMPTHNSFLMPIEEQKVFPVLTARGCTSFCTFCEMGRIKPENVRARSMAHVLDEIEALMEENGATYILFSDDSFEDGDPIPNRRFKSLCTAIKERKLNFRFFMMCKANAVNRDTAEIFSELKMAGLDRLFIGFEAGNDADLKMYGKSARKRDNSLALEILRSLNITVHPGFIMFNPYSTFDRLYENIEFLREFELLCSSEVVCSRFFLFSGVPLTRKVFRDGLVNESVNFPIADGHGYRFQDRRIGHAWEAVNAIGIVPATMDYMLSNYSLTRWLADPNGRFGTDPLAQAFLSMFDEFRLLCNDLLASLLKEILRLAEAGETEIAQSLGSKYTAMSTTLSQRWATLAKAGLLIRSTLSSQGLFPIRNHEAREPDARTLFEAMPNPELRGWA